MSAEAPSDLIVIGAGPAGLSAAITACALGLSPLVLDAGDAPGGQLLQNPTPILDCAGLSAPTGGKLADRLLEHLASIGGHVRGGASIERIDVASGTVVRHGESFSAPFLLLATGARRRTLGVPGEGSELGRGPTPAARRHGADYRGRAVLVVGGGDVALEEAALFAEAGARVILAHRGSAFRGRPDFRARVAGDPRIDVRMQTALSAIDGVPRVTGATLRGPDGEHHVEVAGVFVCAGLAPNSELVRGQVAMDATGFLVTDVQQRTSEPRLYAAGDVCVGSAWSVAAAIGQAAIAVKDIERRLCRMPTRS